MDPEELECASGAWGPRPPAKKVVEEKQPLLVANGASVVVEVDGEVPGKKKKMERRAFCISLFMLVISIPALIGSWCWPAVVAAVVGSTATTAARQAGHLATFTITGTILVLLALFVAWSSRKRAMPLFNKYGPLVFILYSIPLIMLDPLRHLLLDHKIVPATQWGMYEDDCDSDSLSAIKCLTLHGWLITIGSTYTGFVLLIIGSFWNANIVEKLREIRDRWRELRSAEFE